MSVVRSLLLLALPTLSQAGCAADANHVVNDAVRRDSAGIEIVENSAPAWNAAQAWRIGRNPTVAIGSVAGDSTYQLEKITGVTRLSDGRIAVLNSAARQLLLFDRSGNLVRAIGRGGRGPGEFSNPEHLQRGAGDTLVVWDMHYGPITSFDTTGRVLRIDHIDLGRLSAAIGRGRRTEMWTPLPDRSLIAHVTYVPTTGVRSGQLVRPPMSYVHVGRDYQADSLATFGGLPFVYVDLGATRFPFVPLFASYSQIAVGGSPLRIHIADGAPYEIQVFDETGQPTQVIRRITPPLPIPEKEIKAARHRMLKQAKSVGGRANTERMLATAPEPTHYPGVSRMIVDSEGNLWVLNRGDGWSVFGPSGEWLGVVQVPLRRIYEIGPDYLLGVFVDDDDVEHVHEYRLARSKA